MLSEVDNNIQQLWLRGGFPLAYLAISQRASVLWRRNFIQTYINRDLGLLGLQADPQMMERFWRMLATTQGNLWNAENFARSLGITRPTVKDRKSTRLNSSHYCASRMPPSACKKNQLT